MSKKWLPQDHGPVKLCQLLHVQHAASDKDRVEPPEWAPTRVRNEERRNEIVVKRNACSRVEQRYETIRKACRRPFRRFRERPVWNTIVIVVVTEASTEAVFKEVVATAREIKLQDVLLCSNSFAPISHVTANLTPEDMRKCCVDFVS